ncbi:MAG TPA: hypothetical protein VFA09_13100 [Ktedonobacteraceae bacterium]|nr:hypothetical protein [Ktedonobacteraceae bacterium]
MAGYRRNTRGRQLTRLEELTTKKRLVSGIVGAFLLALALLWLAWMISNRFTGGTGISLLPIPGLTQPTPTVGQIAPLTAAGISLGTPASPPALTQQQALLMAGELEPDAAANAQRTSASYVLLSYDGTGTATPQRAITNQPAWMVLYQQIPQPSSDPSADPSQSLSKHYDLYVFLDANTGQELLAIRI